MSKQAILCVDDERIVLISLRDQINKYFGDRCQCEIAESVDEAWEVIEEFYEDGIRILAIVSDWLMPGVKGDEFLIRVHERFPDIVTVLLTGQADADAIHRVHQEANLHAYLTKPWSERTLIETIQSGMEKFHG